MIKTTEYHIICLFYSSHALFLILNFRAHRLKYFKASFFACSKNASASQIINLLIGSREVLVELSYPKNSTSYVLNVNSKILLMKALISPYLLSLSIFLKF